MFDNVPDTSLDVISNRERRPFNPIQDGSFWGCQRMGQSEKPLPLPKI